MKTITSSELERISQHLSKLRFTGMDQNPKGIHDDLWNQVHAVKTLENENERLKRKVERLERELAETEEENR